METKAYIHLISFNCKYHESTFYTLYRTNKKNFDKFTAIRSLKQGNVFGKNGKERVEIIRDLASKYNIVDVFSIKAYPLEDEQSSVELIRALNEKYSRERANYIIYRKCK
jgi:hypothetical protein